MSQKYKEIIEKWKMIWSEKCKMAKNLRAIGTILETVKNAKKWARNGQETTNEMMWNDANIAYMISK